MKYSFVVPVANDKRVYRTINSFLGCKGSNQCECLIVCNGSKKSFINTLTKRYRNKDNIKIFATDRKNISFARNIGVLKSMGDFVVFIDSDCVIDDNYISILESSHSNQDVIRGRVIYDTGKSEFDKNYAWLRTYFNDTFTTNLYTPNLVVRKKIYDTIGLYNENLSGSEDTEWSQRFYEHTQFSVEYIPKLVVYHGLDKAKKAHKTWVLYGLGQSYRAKKAMEIYNQSLSLSLSKAFSELSLLSSNNSLSKNVFILGYDFYKSIGFFNGWLLKWRDYTEKNYRIIEQYYNSEEYKTEIINQTWQTN